MERRIQEKVNCHIKELERRILKHVMLNNQKNLKINLKASLMNTEN